MFEKLVRLMIQLLEKRDAPWTDFLKSALDQWKKENSLKAFLAGFGGMGSFNDFYLPEGKEGPAANRWNETLFDFLRTTSFGLAEKIGTEGKPDNLETLQSVLNSEPKFISNSVFVCNHCGLQGIDRNAVESILADCLLPELVPYLVLGNKLSALGNMAELLALKVINSARVSLKQELIRLCIDGAPSALSACRRCESPAADKSFLLCSANVKNWEISMRIES